MAKANPIRFSTKPQEDEVDIIYYGFRFYIPSTGRWASADPQEELGGRNLYAFLQNNSLGFVDLLGLHVYKIDVTGKSWIFKPITAGWVQRMDPTHFPLLLAAVATTERLTSDRAVDDALDGRFRFASQKTISVDCCGSAIKSFHFSRLFTDVGLEGGFLIPSDITVVDERAYQATASSLRFTWMVKGRPNAAAEPVFQAVRLRTSVFIWHRVIGAVRCVNGVPIVRLSLLSSQFPSADVFYRIDASPSVPGAAYAQKAFARLWDADSTDRMLVK